MIRVKIMEIRPLEHSRSVSYLKRRIAARFHLLILRYNGAGNLVAWDGGC